MSGKTTKFLELIWESINAKKRSVLKKQRNFSGNLFLRFKEN